MRAVLGKDGKSFWSIAVLNFGLAIVSAFVEGYVGHLQNDVSLTWSRTLSQKLRELFFKNNTFYNIKFVDKSVVDADQRITEEIHELSVSRHSSLGVWLT